MQHTIVRYICVKSSRAECWFWNDFCKQYMNLGGKGKQFDKPLQRALWLLKRVYIVIQQNLAFAPLNYACITPYAQTTLLCSNDGGITWTCLLATHVSVTCHRAVWNLTGSDAHCYSAEGSQSEKR